MTKVFIDGSSGTTGLRIYDRLLSRDDISLIKLTEAKRKDPDSRRKAANDADIVFLCLPDQASIETVSMIDNPDTVIIDTSTAHRTADGWDYGFPELRGKREIIRNSKRIANPGCHASGVIALVEPLVRSGVVSHDIKLSVFSLTGYSGGGKRMIEEYETIGRNSLLDAPRMYGLGQNHKHLPEIRKVCSLESDPIFCPIVAPYYSGMEVAVMIHSTDCRCKMDEIKELYREYYDMSSLIRISEDDENGFMSASKYSGLDSMGISVTGNEERIVLVARFDNLGKGASGAAIQNMNLVLGIDETTGLNI